MVCILVIDDDEQMRRTVTRMLQQAGHDVIEAAGGVASIRQFRRNPCAVVITDIVMPDKEGIETIREIRATAPGVRIIAMSGYAATNMQEHYLRLAEVLGADASLTKPFRVEELLQVLNRVLGKS